MKNIPQKAAFAFLLGLGLFAGAYARSTFIPATPPVVLISEPRHDFGVVTGGTDLTHDFEIKNTGGHDLRIEKIDVSCGCVKDAHIDQNIIPQGKTSKLHVVWQPTGNQMNSESITIHSNDPTTPTQQVTIKAKIDSDYSIFPSVVNFGLVTREELPVTRTIIVEKTSKIPPDSSIDLKSQSPNFETKSKKVSEGRWQLELTLRSTAPFGPIDGRISVQPTWPQAKPFNLVVLGKVIGNVAAEPDEVYVETSDVGSTFQQTLQIESEKGVITNVTVQPTAELQGIVKASVQGSSIKLDFTLNPVTSPKTLRGFLKCEVTMDDGTKENLLVPVSLVS